MYNCFHLCSGCGTVGSGVASDTRGPGFKSSHRQLLIEQLFTVNCLQKRRKSIKRGLERPTYKIASIHVGFAENTKPIYDVYYVLDLYPKLAEQYMDVIDQIFVDGAAHDAIVVGHGDFRYDDDEVPDRTLQLIPVIFSSIYLTST